MSDDKQLALAETAEMERQQQPDTGTGAMLQAVLRAMKDPTLEVGRLREFLQIGRELEADNAKKLYNIAWARMQPNLPVIEKNGVITYPGKDGKQGGRTKFAKWDDIHHACMPILNDHGFSVSFDSDHQAQALTVAVQIKHVGGHEEIKHFSVPWLDAGGSKSPAQQAASSFTLAQRHAFCKAFNILTRDEDQDGSSHRQMPILSQDHLETIHNIVNECDSREPGFRNRFLKWIITELHVQDLREVKQGGEHQRILKKLDEKQAALGMK